MTKRDAEHLIAETEGRLCIRYYRRTDGTILTKNCPVGLRALKRRLSRVAAATASAVLSFLAGILAVTGLKESSLIPAMTKGAMINIEKPKVVPTTGTYGSPQPMMGVVAPRRPTIESLEQGRAVLGKPLEYGKRK